MAFDPNFKSEFTFVNGSELATLDGNPTRGDLDGKAKKKKKKKASKKK